MKFALTISAYKFADFTELNVRMLNHVFPGSPVLISDDVSEASGQIKSVAEKYGCAYTCSRVRKNHFAGDLQSIINSLVFAKSVGADVACKISLRLILMDPKLKDMMADRFTNHLCSMIAPCKVQPNQLLRRESMTFTMLPLLTDFLAFKVSDIQPQELIDHYRNKLSSERVKHAALIEALACDLAHGKFKDRHYISDELGRHQPGQPHRFLRKCQNNQIQYLDLARHLGIAGEFNTFEWSKLEGVNYSPRPRIA